MRFSPILALAFTLPLVSSAAPVRLDTAELKQLPAISVKSIKVHHGGGFAAVQPWAEIVYEFASCDEYEFIEEVEEKDDVILVQVKVQPNQRDCRGPKQARTYKTQISSDFGGQRVIVLNPVAISIPNLRDLF